MNSSATNTTSTSPTTSASTPLIPSSRTSPGIPVPAPIPNDPAWSEPARAHIKEVDRLPTGSTLNTRGLPPSLFDPRMDPALGNSVREIMASGSRTRTRKLSSKALEAEKLAAEEAARKVEAKTKTKTNLKTKVMGDGVKKNTSTSKSKSTATAKPQPKPRGGKKVASSSPPPLPPPPAAAAAAAAAPPTSTTTQTPIPTPPPPPPTVQSEYVDDLMNTNLPTWVDPYDRASMIAYEVWTESLLISRVNRERRREGKEEVRSV